MIRVAGVSALELVERPGGLDEPAGSVLVEVREVHPDHGHPRLVDEWESLHPSGIGDDGADDLHGSQGRGAEGDRTLDLQSAILALSQTELQPQIRPGDGRLPLAPGRGEVNGRRSPGRPSRRSGALLRHGSRSPAKSTTIGSPSNGR